MAQSTASRRRGSFMTITPFVHIKIVIDCGTISIDTLDNYEHIETLDWYVTIASDSSKSR